MPLVNCSGRMWKIHELQCKTEMGTILFNGVLLFAHVLLFFCVHAFASGFFPIVCTVFCRCLFCTRNSVVYPCSRSHATYTMDLLPRIVNSFKQYLLLLLFSNIWIFPLILSLDFNLCFSSYFFFFAFCTARNQCAQSQLQAAMINAHKSEWHSFCLFTDAIISSCPCSLFYSFSLRLMAVFFYTQIAFHCMLTSFRSFFFLCQ